MKCSEGYRPLGNGGEVRKMKLMTLNAHGIPRGDWQHRLVMLAEWILRQQPDVIALQEADQTRQKAVEGRIPAGEDNYARCLGELLKKQGLTYDWHWLPVKLGYGKYDEGLALFSRKPIQEMESILLSRSDSYENWKTRRALGIRNEDGWFYSVHMGWWGDEEEPFREQWQRLDAHAKDKEKVWLLGDFNIPAHITGEGYSLISRDGWHDAYMLAEEKDDGVTALGKIDGWEEAKAPMRLDYIFSREPVRVQTCVTLFDGEREPRVSDHRGVLVTVSED